MGFRVEVLAWRGLSAGICSQVSTLGFGVGSMLPRRSVIGARHGVTGKSRARHLAFVVQMSVSTTFISHKVCIHWFEKVNSPTKLSS